MGFRFQVRQAAAGFTLFEILLVVGVMTILSGVAIVAVTNTRESTRVSKLESDVATINAAIQVYTINGGSLPSSASPQEIVNQLKKRADATTGPTIAGQRGSMVDLRLVAEMQTAGEGSGAQPRALWDGTAGHFTVASGGPVGVKNFLLNDALAATDPGTEARTPTVKTGTGPWVWEYTDVAANTSTGPAAGPGTSTAAPGAAPTAPTALQLNAPVFSQSGGSLALINFDIPLTLTNPNPPGTSQIYYSVNGGPLSHYAGQTVTVTPGTSVSAYAVTSDPDHWSDSPVAANTYQAIPVSLGLSLAFAQTEYTFQEAGGAMIGVPTAVPSPGVATVTNTAEIPATYQSSSQFDIRWTLDGSDPLSSGTATVSGAFSGAVPPQNISFTADSWGTGSTLTVKAAAKATTAWFVNSPVETSVLGITTTVLVEPEISPIGAVLTSTLTVTISLASGALYPTNYRIYYTIDGTDPGNNNGDPAIGTLYSGPFLAETLASNGILVVSARIYPPTAYKPWFTTSSMSQVTYSTNTLADGALVGSADINGTFFGSLIYATIQNNINFNSGATVHGNVYFPGTPTITGQENILGYSEWLADGTPTGPQTSPKVIPENGSITPTDYNVKLLGNAIVQGHIYTRHDPPAFPEVTLPDPPLAYVVSTDITLNAGTGDLTLTPGAYKNLTAKNGSAFVIGDPNATTPQVYVFDSLNLQSGGQLEVLGPVILTVKNTGILSIMSSCILGNVDHPEWLQLNMYQADLDVKSNAYAYARVLAPTNEVSLNGTFIGSVTANSLQITGNGVAFTLAPIIGEATSP